MTATTAARKKARAKPAASTPAIEPVHLSDLPRIGAAFQGGFFAGIVRGDAHDFALVSLGYSPKRMTYAAALGWAKDQGGEAPSRADARVLWANLDLHDKKRPSDWFWIGEQYAGSEGCAWFQNFGSGGQYGAREGDDYRARAVRRVPIQ